MIGSLSCERLEDPRIRILPPSPVEPDVGRRTTPGTRAASMSLNVLIGLLSSAAASTTAMVLPSLRLSVAMPAPVTTIWSSAIAVWSSPKSATTDSPALTVTVREPER